MDRSEQPSQEIPSETESKQSSSNLDESLAVEYEPDKSKPEETGTRRNDYAAKQFFDVKQEDHVQLSERVASNKEESAQDQTYIPSQKNVFSSLPQFETRSTAEKEQGSVLPQNCSYYTKKVDLKKIFSPSEGGKEELLLLKDQRCETDFSYTRGTMEYTNMSGVSDTDIISHGLNMLLKTKDDSPKSLHLPNLRNVLNLMQLTPEELSSIQEWLNQKYELSQMYDKEIRALLAFVKGILSEVKKIRENTAKYRRKVQNLEREISLHPRPKLLADLHKENGRLRKDILKLDQEHDAVTKSIVQLHRSMQIEFQNCNKSENSLYLRIQNLKYENKTLRHLMDVCSNDAREVINSLLKKLESSLIVVKRLDGLLLRAKELLEKKSNQTKEASTCLQDQDKLVEAILNSMDLIQEQITNLRHNVDTVKNKSSNLTAHALNLQNEIGELLGNFNSISSNLTSHAELEEGKKKNISEVKGIFDSLELQKRNVKKLERNIAMLEKHTGIQQTEAEERKDEIVDEKEEFRLNWEEKVFKLCSYFDEVDEHLINIKEEEKDRKQALREAARKETVGEALSQPGEETVRLSGRFICSDVSSGELVTKSGICKIAETILPLRTGKGSKENPEQLRGVKSAFAVGLQNLRSVPEFAESQLHGIYAKYNLKELE